MRLPAPPLLYRGLTRLLAASAVSIGGLLSFPTHAAPVRSPQQVADWWIDVANDRATDVQEELRKGGDPNRMNPKGLPAIMQAMRDRAWKVYDVLAADPRTQVDAVNTQDETPLMYLALLGEAQRAQRLIARGAQVNRLGWTPLHYAASRGQMDAARVLIAHKAIINAPSPDGTTPLMMAALSKSKDMVDLLLAAGAEPTTRNLAGLNAADWARSSKADKLAAYLDKLIARREDERVRSRQAGEPAPAGANVPGNAVLDETVESVKPADAADASEPAPAGTAGNTGQKPKEGGNKVRGVEGVGLSW